MEQAFKLTNTPGYNEYVFDWYHVAGNTPCHSTKPDAFAGNQQVTLKWSKNTRNRFPGNTASIWEVIQLIS